MLGCFNPILGQICTNLAIGLKFLITFLTQHFGFVCIWPEIAWVKTTQHLEKSQYLQYFEFGQYFKTYDFFPAYCRIMKKKKVMAALALQLLYIFHNITVFTAFVFLIQ